MVSGYIGPTSIHFIYTGIWASGPKLSSQQSAFKGFIHLEKCMIWFFKYINIWQFDYIMTRCKIQSFGLKNWDLQKRQSFLIFLCLIAVVFKKIIICCWLFDKVFHHLTSFVFVGNQSQSSLPMTRTKERDNGLVEAGDRSWLWKYLLMSLISDNSVSGDVERIFIS